MKPLERMARGWMPRAWIPNAEGARVVVLLADGTQVQTEVVRESRRLHTLKGVAIADVVGWRRAS